MLLKPARKAAPGKPMPPPAPQKATVKTFMAPVRGWVTNENLSAAGPGAALVLDNMFPMANSVRPRGGNQLWATVHATDPCETLMAWRSGTASKLFAATETDIYDVSNPASTTVIPTASLTGQTNGDYSSVNMATAGGEFLLAVNGADRMLQYDGATWRRIDEATHELPYDAQVANFAVGNTVTGATSGATGVVVEDLDSGVTGTLRLKTVAGTYQDNENLQVGGVTKAVANIPSGATEVPSISATATTNFSQIWTFKSRLFLIKKNSMTAYAMVDTDSFGGSLTTINLGGVMQKGGSLVLGGTFSMSDSGSGPDDLCVFISDQGECAVYQGTDPADPNAWGLVGVYPMGDLLHKNATMRAGGNLLVATEMGLVPISTSMSKDESALATDAISKPIEPTWQRYIFARPGKWTIAKWAAKNMAIIGFPTDANGFKATFALNLQTGAWARFTGFTMQTGIEFGGELYIGSDDGMVYKLEGSGSDNGIPYQCLYVGLHERIDGSVTGVKQALMSRSTWRHKTSFNYKTYFAFDYGYDEQDSPASVASFTSSLWDSGLWDTAIWDGTGTTFIETSWVSAAGSGYAVAPVVMLPMADVITPDVELISVDMLYTTGALVA